MSVGRIAFIIGTVVVAFILLAAWLVPPSGRTALDPKAIQVTDPAAIQSMVQLTRPGILVSENYVGHKIRLIRGTLKNLSDKSIRLIEVRIQFTDSAGKTVQENIHPAFEPSQRPLEPGTEYQFEAAFENLPKTWNHIVPNMQVVKVAY